MPKAVVFDLDGTLTVSKSALAPEMGALLGKLLSRLPVAVTSGASYAQFLEQLVARLPKDAHLQNLYLLPTSGAALYTFDSSRWKKVYAETLTEKQMAEAEAAIAHALEATHLLLPEAHGPRIERRQETQVSFSGIGQKAPVALKQEWDPDQKKRLALVEYIKPQLPWAEVRVGGMTTIDITRKSIDKRYGIEHLARRLSIPLSDMLYVGDALYPGGNDEVVMDSGIQTKEVKDTLDTARLIESLLTPA